ncbi:hypothetical protein HMPREF9996_00580 [Aggregatibacter actinomycetemcomitans Y4]|nr:hypothetical protein HMPREF9996_00580 [Aggregatibacter actinomycetemcomitans Y4]
MQQLHNSEKHVVKLFTNSISRLFTPNGAVGKANVQKTSFFVTALFR